ncbi:HNH endonuclease signature motif containing protein [Streptomyces sp. RerS4]|uniref:HNH endonuclease n=1 Tax=Streptomyces sp. RerS4 TaxID=2942449 RepID=UPI00201C0732|nr:HNH endonuclease signature motif containing protein [Streptomyces sp. RerS4]UQX01768.1 HNH endonuclease [Streptomyces sp. RerS4]
MTTTTDDADATSERAGRPCAICDTVMESWRPRSQKYCSDPCREAAAKKQRTERPKDAPKIRRPKPTLTPGTPPVPDPARTRQVPGDPYWGPILAAADRATGGEPCRVCAEPIASKTPWSYRDRHVCSHRCNETLKRRTATRIRRGEIDLYSIPDVGTRAAADEEQRAHYGQERQPRVFGTRDADADFPYEFYGLGPIPGDVVERHGSATTYATAASLGADRLVDLVRSNSEDDAEPILAIHEQTGALLAYTGRTLWWTSVPGQEDPLVQQQSFEGDEGRRWVWQNEIIRDVDEDGKTYDWEAWVCVAEPTPTLWTPAYCARSEKQRRSTRARNSYQARMRGYGVLDATAAHVDPVDVYERDQWVCRLCHESIDPAVEWPDPWSATLDHIKPVSLAGEHSAENLQAAHWVCNIRKGDAWGPGDAQPSAGEGRA